MIVWEGRKSKSAENSLGEAEVTIYADGAEEKNEEYEKCIQDTKDKSGCEYLLRT
jgi:hypothetical protein